MKRYELIGHEGGPGPIVLWFRYPWGFYVRTRWFRFFGGPVYGYTRLERGGG